MTRNTMTLEEMATELAAAYGDSLVAIVLYGSAALDGARSERSDNNLLVVLDRVLLGDAEKVSPAVVRWVSAGNPPPLTFTRQEWRGSGDIFPMEYADVIEHHRVIRGSLDMNAMEVKMDHLRLQLEQEAMGKLLWIRQGAAVAGSRHEARMELLKGSFSKMMVLLRGVLRLHGEPPAPDKAEIIGRAAQLASFDPQALLRVYERVSSGGSVAQGESAALLAGVLASLETVVAHINSFRPASAVYRAVHREVQ